MKKIVLLLASIGLMTAAQAAYKDVKVLKHTETDMIIQAPIDNMIPEIVKKNGVDGVETVAGATNSSKGIQQAVKNALAKAQ